MGKVKYKRNIPKYAMGSNLIGLAGNTLSKFSNDDPTVSTLGSALSGAASGAALGPLGMAGGAIIGGISGLLNSRSQKRAQQEEEHKQMLQRSIQESANYSQQLKNQQANIPTFPNGGKLTEDDIATHRYYNEKLPAILPTLKDKAELYYYGNQLNSKLKEKNPDTYNKLSIWNPDKPLAPTTRIKRAEVVAKDNPKFYLDPDEQKKILGDKWDRYVELRGKYGKDLNLTGEGDDINKPETWNVGARHAVAFNPVTYEYMYKPNEETKDYTNKFNYALTYNPNEENPYVTTKDEKYKLNPETKQYELFEDGGQPSIQQPSMNNSYIINYKGASHANGGIPVNAQSGNPTAITGEEEGAEVEGGHNSMIPQKGEIAVKFKNSSTPYIFSDKLGFAKKAEKIQNMYSKRPNDKISQDAMYDELGNLMNNQEDFKKGLDEHINNITYAEGGKIEIKPENKGKFTSWANAHHMSVQEAAKHVMAHKDRYSSTIIKRANFAKNAAGWKHEDGGDIADYTDMDEGGEVEEYAKGGWIQKAINPKHKGYCTPMTKSTCTGHRRALALRFKHGDLHKEEGGDLYEYDGDSTENMFLGQEPRFTSNTPTFNMTTDTDEQYPNPLYDKSYNSKELSTPIGKNTIAATDNTSLYQGQVSPLGALANITGNAILMKINKKIPTINAPYIQPENIDLSKAREAIRANAVYSRANRLMALRNAGLSQGQYGSAIGTIDSDLNRGVGDELTKSYLSEQTANAGYRNQANMANVENSLRTQMINSQNTNQYNKEQQEYLSNLLNTPAQYLNETQKAHRDALLMQMQSPNVKVYQRNRDNKFLNTILGPQSYGLKFGQ